MGNQLVLVRHSIPEVVESAPARDWRLSEEGRARAQRLAQRLMEYRPECLVSSVEPKARETAEIIAAGLGLELCIVEGLHEHDRSGSTYLSTDCFQSAVREFFEKPDELVFGNETAGQALMRFDQAVRSVLSDHENKTIVIVAHGTVMSLYAARLLGISGFLFWKELGLPSLVVIDRQENALIGQENIV
jgi:broad specificity phosphatase PhoE